MNSTFGQDLCEHRFLLLNQLDALPDLMRVALPTSAIGSVEVGGRDLQIPASIVKLKYRTAGCVPTPDNSLWILCAQNYLRVINFARIAPRLYGSLRAVKVLLSSLRSTLTVLPPPVRGRYDFRAEKLSQARKGLGSAYRVATFWASKY